MPLQATQFSTLIPSNTSSKPKSQIDLMSTQATQFSTLIHSHTSLKPKSQVDPVKVDAAAQDYAISVGGHLLQQVFSANTTGLFGGGQMEVMLRSILMRAIATSMGDIFNIAKTVRPILLKNQEASNGK